MSKTETRPELGTQIKEYLEQQGYEVTEEAKLPGKSGIEHTFDMLAERDDGFTIHTIAIGIAAGGDREAEMGTISASLTKPMTAASSIGFLLPALNLASKRNSWLANSE